MESRVPYPLKEFYNYKQLSQKINIDEEKKQENRELAE